MLNPMNSNNTQKAETNYLFGLLTKAIGNPRTNSLEHRLFNTFSLVNAVLNIAGSFSTFYLENFLVLFALNFGSGILFCGMYYLSRFRGIYFNLYWPLNLTILVFLGFNWITNGGSLGGAHYYLIPSIVVATILLRNQNIFFVYTIFLGVPASLFALEYFHPEYITQFANREQRFIDSSLNYIFVQMLTGGLIIVLTRNLNFERKKSDNLLLNILPLSVAEELKSKDSVIPKHFDSVSVLFTDMAGFTKIAEKMTPVELIGELDEIFSHFDSVSKSCGLEKIKTIGDSYMAAGGLPEENRTNAIDSVLCGLKFQRFMEDHKTGRIKENKPYWELRLGIHTGPVVAGVVGKEKFAYDIWGDTVNTASRLESSGVTGRVNISGATFDLVKDFFDCEHRGKVSAKNKGEIDMYLVNRIKPELSVPGSPYEPNESFKKLCKPPIVS